MVGRARTEEETEELRVLLVVPVREGEGELLCAAEEVAVAVGEGELERVWVWRATDSLLLGVELLVRLEDAVEEGERDVEVERRADFDPEEDMETV